MNLCRTRLWLNAVRYLPFRCFSTGKKNYYDVLGISKTANSQEIKEAFYSLSKKYHPDVVGTDSRRFLEIKEAYDVLKDDEKRRAYDAGFDTVDYDRFKQQWPYTDFSRGNFRSGRRAYEYRSNHYSQEEIDRIWKQFQEQVKNRTNADYDAEMRRRAQERQYNDYIRRQANSGWQRYADEFNRRNKPSQENVYSRTWSIFNRIAFTYIVIFFTVALIRTIFGPLNSRDQKIIVTEQKAADSGYTYAQSKERLQRMMETPPTSPKTEDPNYPYGLPTYDRKD